MKNSKLILSLLIGILFFSCDHNVKVETVLNEDDSIDRTITLENEDSMAFQNNYFGINDKNGWTIKKERKIEKESKPMGEEDWNFTFSKHFSSIEESNHDLNNDVDTLFHIEANLEKRFRWFYTYTTFSDTYKAIDRFKLLNQSDFLTPEDYAFMKRLPPEGDSISKADQLFLEDLTTKINDVLVPSAFFEESFDLVLNIATEKGMDSNWIDSIQHHKASIFNSTIDNKELTEDYFFLVFDSLQIPFPKEGEEEFYTRMKSIESRLDFMSYANTGKYLHTIKMPGEIINTNADSLAGDYAVWRPSVYKFIANDYTMYAETRKLNLWAVIVSILLVMATVYVFVKKK